MSAIAVQAGIGKGRDPWLIRRHLAQTTIEIDGKTHVGVSGRTIARLAKTSPSTVTETIKGVRNHDRTLQVLENVIGVPRSLLYPYEEKHNSGEAA